MPPFIKSVCFSENGSRNCEPSENYCHSDADDHFVSLLSMSLLLLNYNWNTGTIISPTVTIPLMIINAVICFHSFRCSMFFDLSAFYWLTMISPNMVARAAADPPIIRIPVTIIFTLLSVLLFSFSVITVYHTDPDNNWTKKRRFQKNWSFSEMHKKQRPALCIMRK